MNNLVQKIKTILKIETIIAEYIPLNNNKALCPFHEDHQPSLVVYPDTQSFYCFGCNKGGDIIDFIMAYKNQPFRETLRELGYKAGIDMSTPYLEKVTMERMRQESIYPYHDPAGNPTYEIVRSNDKKKFSIRHKVNGKWVNKKPANLYPYNLPEVLKSKVVWIVEGEKDADRLIKEKLTATTNPFGAGKWREEYNQWFRDKQVNILVDADKPGRDHGRLVVDNLLPIAKSVKLIDLFEGENNGQDVSDFLDRYTIENLRNFVDSLPIQLKSADLLKTLYTWDTIKTLDIQVDYVIDGLLPKQAITLLFGKGGVGKTWLALNLGKVVALGESFGSLTTQKTSVVYIDFENSLPLLKERVTAIGGNCDNFYLWCLANEERPPKLDRPEWIRYFNLPEGSLLVFDSLRASHSLDENSSQDMTLIVNNLKILREKGFTIILLHHTPKVDEGIFKGSTAIADLTDLTLGLEKVERGATEFSLKTVYRLGTRVKTRYKPVEVFLKFDPARGFETVPDPAEEKLQSMQEVLRQSSLPLKQKEFVTKVRQECGYSYNKISQFLEIGENKHWIIKRGPKNTAFYEAL